MRIFLLAALQSVVFMDGSNLFFFMWLFLDLRQFLRSEPLAAELSVGVIREVGVFAVKLWRLRKGQTQATV